jgi:regulator of replication initiation timing
MKEALIKFEGKFSNTEHTIDCLKKDLKNQSEKNKTLKIEFQNL